MSTLVFIISAGRIGKGAAVLASVALAFFAVEWVYLHAVVAWGDYRTRGLNYYGRPPDQRSRFKRILRMHRRALTPILWLLGRVSRFRFTFAEATFSYGGVAGPRGTCSPESFRRATEYEPRPEDLFVAAQMKCGTTWMQHVVYQVLTRGAGDLVGTGTALYAVSPWIEGLRSVSLDNAPRIGAERPSRMIKTHLPVQLCPYSTEAKYIYVCRHPLSCFASCADFIAANSGPFSVSLDEIEAWFRSEELMWWGTWPSHVRGWWNWSQRRGNVLFVTFEEMRRDLAATVRQVAEFLSIENLRADEVERIVDKCSFDYMRRHQDAFEMTPPHLFQGRSAVFVSGRLDRHSDLAPPVRHRLLAWCRAEMADSDFPLERYYPDLAESPPPGDLLSAL